MNAKLIMFTKAGQRREFALAKPVTTLGRGSDCNLRIPLPTVSRHHCRILIKGEQLVVSDLGSSNGTFVNNRRVTETPLRPGDRLGIGGVVFTVQLNGHPQEGQPAEAAATDLEIGEALALGPDEVAAQAGETEISEVRPAGTSAEFDPMTALEELDDLDNQPPKGKKK
jgi:pSer/pThr/pTyr-binding forkhead associated (FHA) protein